MSNRSEHREVERTYDVDDDWELPDLTRVPGVEHVTSPVEHRLEAVYFDTEDLQLLRARTTLRRRVGGADQGWHLKLPAGADRVEVRLPLGRATRTVPKELRDLTRAARRGRDLVPVVRLESRRVLRSLTAGGQDAVEVVDDHVTSHVLLGTADDGTTVTTWREVEAEVTGGPDDALDAVEDLLLRSGARPAASASKLARALSARRPEDEPVDLGPHSPAVDVVLAYCRAQLESLALHDTAVRRDAPDAVHRMRVVTRRLRSALATFGALVDDEATSGVRDELRWLAGVLGAARDAEVMRGRLAVLVSDEPPELLLGPVARRLDDELSATYRAALDELRDVLDGDRYLGLLRDLDSLLADARPTTRGRRSAEEVLPPLVRRSWRRVRRRRARVEDPQSPVSLHDVRKAAKRARYAGEVAALALGSKASRFAAAMEDVQKLLGEHQDAVTAQSVLRRVGVEAHLSGDNAFSFGRLHAVEQHRAEEAEARFPDVWRRSARRRYRRWLR